MKEDNYFHVHSVKLKFSPISQLFLMNPQLFKPPLQAHTDSQLSLRIHQEETIQLLLSSIRALSKFLQLVQINFQRRNTLQLVYFYQFLGISHRFV